MRGIRKTGRARRVIAMVAALVGLCIGYTLLNEGETIAASPSVTARLDYSPVPLGRAVTLQVVVEGLRGAEVESFTVPPGLSCDYRGPSTQFRWVNGQSSYSVTHTYVITPTSAGAYALGPFRVKVGGKLYQADPVNLDVLPAGGAPAQDPAAGGEADLDDLVFLELSLPQTQAYVGQRIPLEIRLFCAEEPTIDRIQPPQLQTANLLVESFGQPERGRIFRHGREYEVLSFKTFAYPLAPGQLSVGPAELTCLLLVEHRREDSDDDDFFRSFFRQTERRPLTLRAEAVPLSVKQLPAAGRPTEYSGGIGRFNLSATANTTAVKLGEPITLSVEVAGEGNLDRIKPNFLAGAAGFKVYPPQRRTDGTGGSRVLFEQVVIPLDPAVKAIPPLRLAYFDPVRGQYAVSSTTAIPIAITGGDQAALRANRPELFLGEDAESDTEVLGYDLVYLHEKPGRLRPTGYRPYRQAFFWAIPGLLVLMLLANSLWLRRREWLAAGSPAARWLRARQRGEADLASAERALQAGRSEEAVEAAFRAVQHYFGTGLARPAGGITEEVAAALADRGEEYQRLARKFFALYDGWRYAGQGRLDEIARELIQAARGIVRGGY